MDFEELSSALVQAVTHMNLGGVEEKAELPGDNQHATNALGITLAWRWARGLQRSRDDLHLYAAAYENSRSSHLDDVPAKDRKEINRALFDYQFITDIFIERWDRGFVDVPLLAAEVEACPDHGISKDPKKCDYLWDFYKLMYARTPRRIFVATTRKDRISELGILLNWALERTGRGLPITDKLCVVLLPAGASEFGHVRIASTCGGNPLVFKRVAFET